MLLHIPNVLDAGQLRFVRERLDQAGDAWVDGRATAGYQGAPVKRNQQIAEYSPVARELGDVVVASIERNPLFISAVLPNQVYPPLFNRYEDGMHFGSHVDGAVRVLPNGVKLRTDVSATLFISEPDEYDGGELVTELTPGGYSAKLPAGDLLLYPANTVHHVTKVTRGARIAMIFWTQSMVRDLLQRTLLFNLAETLLRLERPLAETPEITQLYACYYNLIRMWATP